MASTLGAQLGQGQGAIGWAELQTCLGLDAGLQIGDRPGLGDRLVH